jgi:RNA polymerase sigma-70 factor (ECF subfamily)
MFVPLLVGPGAPDAGGPTPTPARPAPGRGTGIAPIGRTATGLAALLTETAEGNVNAFARVYDLTSARVYSLVARQVGTGAAAAVTQQVYVALWRQAATFDPSLDQPLAWIVSIAHCLAHRVPRTERGPASGLCLVPTENGKSGCCDLAGCALTRDQQDILTLVYLGGYTREQVAVLLGVPALTVTAIASAGLRRLSTELPAA